MRSPCGAAWLCNRLHTCTCVIDASLHSYMAIDKHFCEAGTLGPGIGIFFVVSFEINLLSAEINFIKKLTILSKV